MKSLATQKTEAVMKIINAGGFQRKAVGQRDNVRWISKRTYSGTGTKQEILELDKQLMQLIGEKRFGYKYIEEYLSSVGYQRALIRARFKVLTGVNYEEFMPFEKFLAAPPTIPGINYGWGVSKTSKYEHYFIMPFYLGYTIFGQKDYLVRDEVSAHLTLELAREAMGKLVKEYIYYDKVVNIPAKPGKEMFTEPVGTYERGQRQKHEELIKKAALIVKGKGEEGEELEDDKVEKEKTFEEADNRLDTPMEEIMKEVSPQDTFETEKKDVSGDIVPKNIKKVIDYISAKDEAIAEYYISIDTFKYKQEELDRATKDVQPAIEEEKVEEYFSSSAIITVVINIENRKLPEDQNTKQGYMVFSVIKDDIVSDDTFKAEDNRIYALTKEGLDSLFDRSE